jgi:hypothetical protein
MTRIALTHLPEMRVQGLVIDELPDEVLVYDLDRHKAHCLNQTAALVWHCCDGKTSVAEIARRLKKQLDAPFNEELVWLALRQLDELHLLKENISLPAQLAGMSRRAMIRNLSIAAAIVIPLATSIVSPPPAQASTCAGGGQSCVGMSCCPGHVCNGSTCS